jgi:hypothetical protein
MLNQGNPDAAMEVPTPGHWRFVSSLALLVIALVATPLVIVGAWVRAEILDTDQYVDTVAPLADDPAMQQYVAGQLADAFNSNVDLESWLADHLPDEMQAVSPVIARGAESAVQSAADRFTASPAFAALWADANRAAHEVIVRVLTGERDALELSGGTLTLDLSDALQSIQAQLVDRGFDAVANLDLSGIDGEVVIADGEQLSSIESAREVVGNLNDLVWVLAGIAVVAAIGSIAVARRRGSAAMRLGIGLAAVCAAAAVAVAVTRNQFVSAVSDVVPSTVSTSLFDTLVDSIRDLFRLVFVIGVATALVVAIASLPDFGRRWARPTQIGVALIGLGVLIALTNPSWGALLLVVASIAVVDGVLEFTRRRQITVN